jgi:hypothetical protein
VLTAHWYGRLHADYLERLEAQCRRASELGKPFYVTEFGDWGLPDMPRIPEPPFWDTRAAYATALATTQWPGTIRRFARETQRYQGLSDRLQGEVMRRHDAVGGYCLTELTDVPFELNGILDLHRRPKPLTVAEIRRMNQPVLPMLRLESFVYVAGARVRARLYVANDSHELTDVDVRVHFDVMGPQRAQSLRIGTVPAHSVTTHAGPRLIAPETFGNHDLRVDLFANNELVASNSYPVHIVHRFEANIPIRLARPDDILDEALRALGTTVGDAGPLVVGEGALDAVTAPRLREHVEQGGTALVLAQGRRAAEHYPVSIALQQVETKWGSSVFHFTTDTGALPSLPRRNLIVGEDATVHAHHVVSEIAGSPFPEEPAVVAYKPVPDAMTGTLVGRHRIADGELIFCQYRLVERALDGDAAARGMLADLLNWAVRPRPALVRKDLVRDDGRRVRLYSWEPT